MGKRMNEITGDLSRRSFLGQAALAAAAAPLAAGAQSAPNRSGAGSRAATMRRYMPQGGRGPIKVMFVSGYHPYDRENLYKTFDLLGEEITWTNVFQPAAETFYDPKAAANWDVFVHYDAFMGAPPGSMRADHWEPPTREMQDGLKRMTQSGDKGFVFLHHGIAAWTHSWPAGVNGSNAYVEMMGAAADWGTPLENIRGKNYPVSGYRQQTEQHVTVVDKQHPITQGLGDGFDIVDEVYLCPMFEDSVHCLLRSNFKPVEETFMSGPSGVHVGAGHPPGSNMTAWVKTAESSPVAYIQHGHDDIAWSNKHFQTLLLNAIKWAASPEAKSWAKANPTRIFV
jgi:uncharacterized protein